MNGSARREAGSPNRRILTKARSYPALQEQRGGEGIEVSDWPLVTIGISTYNRANGYLPQALDSALAQTYPNIEIVVSDNCSTDGTEELVRSRSDARVRYIKQERNIGANNNFNMCLSHARGVYFLLLHDDDRIDPDFVSSCIAAARQHGEVGLIRTGTRIIDERSEVVAQVPNTTAGLSPLELFRSWFERETSFYLCSTLFHTDRLRDSGGFRSKTNLLQDVAAMAKLLVPYGRVDVPDVKASFRRHQDNKGSEHAALEWAQDSVFLLDLLCELLPEHEKELRRLGRPYLCRKCYRNVANIPSAAERWRTYFQIDAMFGRSYSPLRYVLERQLKELRVHTSRFLKDERAPVGQFSGS